MDNIQAVYFLGIGGIGMSNLARYFLHQGKQVAGYDRVETPLTKALSKEGAVIHYIDDVTLIPDVFKQDKENVLVVFTPAIPNTSLEKNYFISNNFQLKKRAEVLGIITKSSKALCCAGTHGKTTTSSMLAHIMHQSSFGCNAFLGGILKNYDSNLLLSETSEFTVIEADEYDRSFHWLSPYMTLVTSVAPDHLDIYHTEEEYRKSFAHYLSLVQEGGNILLHHEIDLPLTLKNNVTVYRYSIEKGDFRASNIRIGNGTIIFDFITPSRTISDIELGVPIKINIDNAIGSMALAHLCGVEDCVLRAAMKTYAGAKRRFDFKIKTDKVVYIDDYAHHPDELNASITSVKELYPNKKIVGIFQPHLYSRTKDFVDEFAESLSHLDELWLMDIYPARELPIEGVTSDIILEKVTCKKRLVAKNELLALVKENKDTLEVLMTLGAGDIDVFVEPIKEILE